MIKKLAPIGLVVFIATILLGYYLFDSFTQSDVPEERLEYAAPRQLCLVADERINEASGLACAHETPGAFWTHNDSGDGPFIYLINTKGETLASRAIEGAGARDWEDIASFILKEQSYILIGDVGDNPSRREECQLYLIKEPRLEPGIQNDKSLELEKTIHFQYEDGAHNCESVGVDPTEGNIYLVSKMEGDRCQVYELPLTLEPKEERLTARSIAVLEIPTTVAMDISPDGLRAVILTYQEAYEYTRLEGESWEEGFSTEPRILSMPPRAMGEAISFGPEGQSLFLVSENINQPMWEVPLNF